MALMQNVAAQTRPVTTPVQPKLLELNDLLAELRRRGWTLILWGPRTSPELMGAMFRWPDCADVLLLRGDHQATAYRVPTPHRDSDTFNPELVSYQYHQCPLWTLRAILSLPRPGQPGAPTHLEHPKSPECFLPEHLPHPILIRPLSTHLSAREFCLPC